MVFPQFPLILLALLPSRALFSPMPPPTKLTIVQQFHTSEASVGVTMSGDNKRGAVPPGGQCSRLKVLNYCVFHSQIHERASLPASAPIHGRRLKALNTLPFR